MADWVLHVDLDQFIAAVEVLRDPSLRGRPVVVGGNGDPTERAVVATASYEAREFGVRSGLPLRTAFKKLPDAVYLPVDHALYEAASADVMAVLRSFPVVVEVLGWDEAFVGTSVDDPAAFARSVQAAVLEKTGLHCSVGIGDNKLRAKIATEFGKPAGVFQLTRENWAEVMGHRPTSALWGIGAKTERKLAELGLVTQGAGDTVVSATPWVVKSRSHEKTFQQDLASLEDIRREVVALAHQVAADVVAEGRPAVRVGVKVRFVPFFTKVRLMKLPAPTSSADELAAAALVVLDRFEHGRAVRLLGVRAEFSDDDVEPKPSPSTYQ
ncbi:DNA polymerase IV [Lentzea sp. BCCO 10_0798]|uniref:DNA polymerase IV n=1 Tax=Lentzea kristufekii TaxID=3095430 RepID=A0ABU4THU0_9PSEU|nr:DNA polymerase IV [Lentzea sp. BCCO 10_0798]MDX8047824.1 DNA polymerase IV [Lentzea sp. BCCO 10_0798]